MKRYKLGEIGEIRMCKRILKEETNSVGGVPFFKIGTFGGQADVFITKEKCLSHIPCETGVKIISRLNAINRCFMIQNMILDFFSEFYNLNMFSLISPQEINDILQTIFEISCYEGDVGKKANYIYQKIRAKNNKI